MAVIGNSGTGKTTFVKRLLNSLSWDKLYLCDPNRQYADFTMDDRAEHISPSELKAALNMIGKRLLLTQKKGVMVIEDLNLKHKYARISDGYLRGDYMVIRVAALGPEGTFSEAAVLQHWKEDVEKDNVKILYTDEFAQIFELVEQGKADYGVIPLEDSVKGDVYYPTDPLELLRKHRLYMVGEEYIDVVHCLLGKKTVKDIEIVASHPQVLLHCQRFLRIHLPSVEQKPVKSSAEGARLASKDSRYGAIGSERLAEIYSLNILSKEVHDNGINSTRLGIFGQHSILPSNPAKTSIAIYPSTDRAGVLFSILKPFADGDINLTRIVSRPIGRDMGEYLFHLDFEGNPKDPKIKRTLEQLKKLKIVESVMELGSYRKGELPRSIVISCIPEKIAPLQSIKREFAFWDNDEDKKYDAL